MTPPKYRRLGHTAIPVAFHYSEFLTFAVNSLQQRRPSMVRIPFLTLPFPYPNNYFQYLRDQIIPVRCFSCGKVIGDKWNAYLELLSQDKSEGCVSSATLRLPRLIGLSPTHSLESSNSYTLDRWTRVLSEALDELQLKRYCCRRMVLTHVDLIEKLLHYNRTSHSFFMTLSLRSCVGLVGPPLLVLLMPYRAFVLQLWSAQKTRGITWPSHSFRPVLLSSLCKITDLIYNAGSVSIVSCLSD